jgi:hypothetical protein
MEKPDEPIFNCAICDRPIDLTTTKTNDIGQPVHEECYTLMEALKRATQRTTPKSAP